MSESTKKVIGIILLFIGAFWIISSISSFAFNLLFRGWWTLFIIIPSICAIVRKQNRQLGFIGLGIGFILFILAQFGFSWGDFFRFSLAILMIIGGISILLSHSPKLHIHNNSEAANGNRLIDISFSRRYFHFNSETMNDIKCKVVFGILTLDLRNAYIDKDITIDCDCTLGSVEILLPSQVIVNQKAHMVLASTKNEHINVCNLSRPQVTVSGSVTLGLLSID
ncbi:MAG: hypothetical protein ACI3ZF_04720 [Candidatus Cryptobacteroides sp.]